MGRSSGGGGRSSGGFGGGRSSGGFSNHSHRNSNYSRTSYNRQPLYHRHYSRPIGPTIFVGPRTNGYGGSSLLAGFIVLAIVFMVAAVIFLALFDGSSSSVASNTTQREPLQGVVQKTDWYDDDLGWIRSGNQLIEGLEYFYDKTGVQPYVMMIPYNDSYWNGNSLNSDAAISYLNEVYDEKFNDEGHFIFAYFSCLNDIESEMDGEFRYLNGYAVDTIMDNEALNIFEGYYYENYYDTSLSTDQLIAKTFSDTADSIMSKPTNFFDFAKIAIFIIGAIVIIIVIYKMYQTKVKRDQEKEEYVKDILDKPLETFGDDTSELEKKYQ